jgi:EAL domain-containing protein (putative c-di-GMP-specific phosphodiesterase class I)
VKSIVTTAQTFGLAVVAAGVKTAAQAQSLIGLGVPYLQGYLFSRVLSPDAAGAWLRDRCLANLGRPLKSRGKHA